MPFFDNIIKKKTGKKGAEMKRIRFLKTIIGAAAILFGSLTFAQGAADGSVSQTEGKSAETSGSDANAAKGKSKSAETSQGPHAGRKHKAKPESEKPAPAPTPAPSAGGGW